MIHVVCVCMCACVYVCTCACVHVCTRACVRVRESAHIPHGVILYRLCATCKHFLPLDEGK